MPVLPDPVTYAIPGFVVLMLAEMVYGHLSGRVRFEPRDTFASLAMGLGNTVASAAQAGAVTLCALWLYQVRLFDIGSTGWAWSGWTFATVFIVDDLCYYWFHRTAHRVRWFWASHVIHHSSQHYNLSTALRQTWTGFFSLSFAFRLPLIWIGFPPAIVFFCMGLNLVYQFWIHTEAITRMPAWFEAVMNTPSHHRVHHATNPRYLDANYAGVFIVWDRLFGSFVAERSDDPCRYGIIHNLGTFNPLRIAVHEWVGMARDMVRSRHPGDMIGYLFGPPGWSPDGSRETTDRIKQRWAALAVRVENDA